MSLKLARYFYPTRALGIVTFGLAFTILAIYLIFDFYLSSVGEEIVGSWVQSEAIAIQEGNLLSAITKNQRVLMSSQFVKGVVLLDTSINPAQPLIEFGSKMSNLDLQAATPGKVQVLDSGFLDKKTLYRISHRPELVLVFDIRSAFLVKAFFGTVFIFVGFLLALIFSIKRIERREYGRREKFIKDALTNLVEKERPSSLIRREFPFLAEWWSLKRKEIESARRNAIANEGKILFGEMAARVAHDIRSPLNTLKVVSDSAKDMPEETRLLLDRAIQRIREVASGIVDKNKTLLALEKTPAESSPKLLFPVVSEIFDEKRLQYSHLKVSFRLDIAPDTRLSFAAIQEDELKRIVSNLVDNSIEAQASAVLIKVLKDKELINICIEDNGCGISGDVQNQIGEKGFSSKKKNGSGLGIYYAKQILSHWSGSLEIKSTENLGTILKISLPMAETSSCFVDSVDFSQASKLLILDDDPSIHALWRRKVEAGYSDLSIEHFFDSQSALDWAKDNLKNTPGYLLLSDLDLSGSSESGLDVLRSGVFDLSRSVLVTSSYELAAVQEQCLSIGVPILPKPLLS